MIDLEAVNKRMLQYSAEGIFGRWHLDGGSPSKALLGKGNFGCVYAIYCEVADASGIGKHRETGALKIVPIDRDTLELSGQSAEKLQDELRRARGEVSMLSQFRGEKHILNLRDSKEIIRHEPDGSVCWDLLMRMDKMIGLDQALRDMGLTAGTKDYMVEVLRMWNHISNALHACQRHGIVHADVKPENILYQPDYSADPGQGYKPGRGDYCLGDFGTAIDKGIFKKVFFGTEEYMSPEMFYQQDDSDERAAEFGQWADSRADMYSLAVVVYELLNGGRLPLQRGNDRTGAYELRLDRQKPVPEIKGVPKDINRVLLQCLELLPPKRYESCGELEEATEELYKKYRKNGSGGKGKAAMAAVGVLVLGGAAALLWRVIGAGGSSAEKGGDALPVTVIDAPAQVTLIPTEEPVVVPAVVQTDVPEAVQTVAPTAIPTAVPTAVPTAAPTAEPTPEPVVTPEAGLAGIRIADADENGIWVGADKLLSVSGSAQPNTTLEVAVNGSHFGYYMADGDGGFALEIPSRLFAEGENLISFSYYAPDGAAEEQEAAAAAAMDMVVRYDADAPVISVQERIDQYTQQLDVSISDDDNACFVQLIVDGTVVQQAIAKGGTAVFTGVDALGLTGMSRITVTAADSSGNTSEATVTYRRQPADIVLDDPAALDGLVIGNGAVVDMDFSAEPGSVLRILCGQTEERVEVNADGRGSLTISAADLQPGQNTVTVAYSQVEGLAVEDDGKQISFSVVYDGEAPDISVSPAQIVHRDTPIQVEPQGGELLRRIELAVDGQVVAWLEDVQPGRAYTLSIQADTPLEKTSRILVSAWDAAGNLTQAAVDYVSVDPIVIDDGAGLEEPMRSGDELVIAGTAEPGATLLLTGGGMEAYGRADEDGQYSFVLAADSLPQGESTLMVAYDAGNGFPEEALEGTSAAVAVYCDTQQPAVDVSPTLLTRDTAELTVSITNGEPRACGVRLLVNGAQVWPSRNGETAYEQIVGQTTIDGLRSLGLRAGNDVAVEVTDYVNDPVRVTLTYENTSTQWESYAFSETDTLGSVNAGDVIEDLQAWAICDSWDMGEGNRVHLYLVGGGTQRGVSFEPVVVEDAPPLPSGVSLDRNYANTVYRLGNVRIPEDCPSGTYALQVYAVTDNEERRFDLGTVTVEDSANESGVGEAYVNASENYAIGLDEPMQASFPAESVVLTGWVYRESGRPAYFDRCVLLDPNGREITGSTVYITDEIVQYPREGVKAEAERLPGGDRLSGGTEEDAGFVMRLDLSGMGLADGAYTLRLYAANVTGEAWETVWAKVIVDSAAPPVTEEDISDMTMAWAPVEEPEPQPGDAAEQAQQQAAEQY